MFKIVPSVVYKDSFLGTEMGEEVILASLAAARDCVAWKPCSYLDHSKDGRLSRCLGKN